MQDLLILSHLNDLTNCWRRFNVVIMMPSISAVDHARKLNIDLPSIDKMFPYRYT